MIEQSRPKGAKAARIEELGGLIMRFQDANQRYDEAVGEVYGLGPTERLCLSTLFGGPQSASAIAQQVRLTPAAVTALIDRLEARGFVRRLADASDRRKVMVELAQAAEKLVRDAYMPMQEAAAVHLGKYTEAELRLFAKILSDTLAVQEAMTHDFLLRHGKS